MEFKYVNQIASLIDEVIREENGNMEKAVDVLYEAINNKKSIYTFGASHAGIMSEELFYRAGGLMLFNPIFGRELMLDTSPITMTSKMEQTPGYGEAIAKSRVDFKEDDVLIVHSVSGRNPVGIEIAKLAKEKGAKVIVLTNLTYSKTVSSRHPSGKKLYEFADIIIDNHGVVGDACVECVQCNQLLRRPIRKVALCGGSGSFLLEEAIQAGASALSRRVALTCESLNKKSKGTCHKES